MRAAMITIAIALVVSAAALCVADAIEVLRAWVICVAVWGGRAAVLDGRNKKTPVDDRRVR